MSSQTLVETWLRIDASAKPNVYKQVASSAELRSLSYWLEIIFSAGIATFGLVLNSPAVIIGAMLISPLMSPIMAMGLALAVGDLYLTIQALLNLVLSIAAAIGFSAVLVWLLPFHTLTREILSRTNPNLLDLGIALFSGLAGSIVVSRGATSGGVTALPGVAIAVALMPPLCAMGFGLGSGADLTIMGGAGLLFLTNIVAIVSSAFIVFLLVGMNSPAVQAEIENSYSGVPERGTFLRRPAVRMLVGGGKLRWRILVLIALLASIAIPLRKALLQVAAEATDRAAAERTVKRLVANASVVSQQVQVGRNSIVIRLLSTRPISKADVSAARDDLIRRTGRDVDIAVEEVASRRELESLVERMNTTEVTAPPPEPENIEAMRTDLLAHIRPAVQAVWPTEITLQDLDVVLTPANTALNLHYEAPQDLDPVTIDLLQKTLREKLNAPTLTVNAQRTSVPVPATKVVSSRQRLTDKK